MNSILLSVVWSVVVQLFFYSSVKTALSRSHYDQQSISASLYSLFCLRERKQSNTSSWFFSDLVVNSASHFLLLLGFSFCYAFCGTYMITSSDVGVKYLSSLNFNTPIDDMPSLSLSALLGVLGLLSLFGAFPRAYSAAISTTDLISFKSVRETVLCSLLCFSFAFLCDEFEKSTTYFIPDQFDSRLYRLFISLFSYGLYLSSLACAGFAAIKIVGSFEEKKSGLNNLYKDVRHYTRKSNDQLNINNTEGINACYKYYWEELLRNGNAKEEIIEHRNIHFISFQDHYKKMPLISHLWVWVYSLFCLALITVIPCSLIAYAFLANNTIWWQSAVACMTTNFIVLFCIFCFNDTYKKFYIRAAIGAWGFEVIDQEKICFFNERRQYNGIHFKRHLRSHYNIVSFFRNALQAGENVSELALKQIFRNTRETNYGCILCFVCLYLFKEYYPENKTDFKTELIDIVKSTGLDIDLLRHNALELIKDIISDGKECYYPEYWPSSSNNTCLSLNTFYSYTIDIGDATQ